LPGLRTSTRAFRSTDRMGERFKVATTSEIQPGSGKAFKAGGTEVALFNVGGKFFASTNLCPHRGGPLAEGTLDGSYLTCPWHNWQFDLEKGCLVKNPNTPLTTFAVTVENDDIFVEI
jgi:nitrite reductase (NADH) small subunit